jgi:uncharacterized protein YpmB
MNLGSLRQRGIESLRKRSKVLILILAAILVAILTIGLALAATVLTTSHNYTVVEGAAIQQSLSVGTGYDDSLTVEWGDIAQGTSIDKSVYVRNTGTNTVRVTFGQKADITDGVSITSAPEYIELAPGASGVFVVTLAASGSADIGAGVATTGFTTTII